MLCYNIWHHGVLFFYILPDSRQKKVFNSVKTYGLIFRCADMLFCIAWLTQAGILRFTVLCFIVHWWCYFLLKKLKTWVTHRRAYSRMHAHWVSVACLSSAHCMGWLSVLRICGQQSLMSLLKLSHSAINHVDKILQAWQTNVYLPGALYSPLSLGLPTLWNAMAFKQNQLTTQQWSL